MTCSLKMGRPSYSSRLLCHHSTFVLSCADQAGIQAHCRSQFEKLMHIYHLGPSMYTVNELEEHWSSEVVYCAYCAYFAYCGYQTCLSRLTSLVSLIVFVCIEKIHTGFVQWICGTSFFSCSFFWMDYWPMKCSKKPAAPVESGIGPIR